MTLTLRPAPGQKTHEFQKLQEESVARGEANDCGVKAVSLVCGISYQEAHALLASKGRKKRGGSPHGKTEEVITELGFKLTPVEQTDISWKYPARYRLRQLTTHHPDRFPQAWAGKATYLMFTRGHVLAIIDGVNHDWSRGRAKRCTRLYRVEKGETK